MTTDLAMLIEAVAYGYGLRLQELTPVEGGADAYARAFRAVDEAGTAYFVKAKASLDPGLALCVELREAGIQEVLAPLPTLGGGAAYPIPDGVLLVYPWIKGQNGFQRPPPLESWRTVGAALRRVHDVELPQSVLSQLATETFAVPGVDKFRDLMASLLSSQPKDEVEEAMATLLQTHQSKIDGVIRRTAELGESCRQHEPVFVPCHTDVHMANVLVEPSAGVYIIDWDAPRLAPRECDLMFFVDRGILGRHGPAEEQAFFQGYGLHELNPTLIDYYKHERTLSDIVSFAHEAVAMASQTVDQKWEAVKWFKAQLEPPSS